MMTVFYLECFRSLGLWHRRKRRKLIKICFYFSTHGVSNRLVWWHTKSLFTLRARHCQFVLICVKNVHIKHGTNFRQPLRLPKKFWILKWKCDATKWQKSPTKFTMENLCLNYSHKVWHEFTFSPLENAFIQSDLQIRKSASNLS